MLSQPEHYRRQCHKCSVVNCPLLVACGHATPLLQTQDATLHHVAMGIIGGLKHNRTPPATAFLEAVGSLIAPLRDHPPQIAPTQRLTTTRITGAFVQSYLARSLPRPTATQARHTDGIEGGFHPLTVAVLPFREHQRQRTGFP